MRAARVYTMGYQGKSIESFIDTLKDYGVTVVVDVRRRPLSRRPGFSKRKLASKLEENGIEYRHVPELGMPIEWLRLRDVTNGNAEVLELYRSSMDDRSPAFRDLSLLAVREVICLMCFESNHRHCHRGVLADALRARYLDVSHLQ